MERARGLVDQQGGRARRTKVYSSYSLPVATAREGRRGRDEREEKTGRMQEEQPTRRSRGEGMTRSREQLPARCQRESQAWDPTTLPSLSRSSRTKVLLPVSKAPQQKKTQLTSSLSAPQPQNNSVHHQTRRYSTLPSRRPTLSTSASYTFYSHSISSTISASPSHSSLPLLLARASISRSKTQPSLTTPDKTLGRRRLCQTLPPVPSLPHSADAATNTPASRALTSSLPPRQGHSKVSLRSLRSAKPNIVSQLQEPAASSPCRTPKFSGWESPSLLARLLGRPRPSTTQAL